jgi:hypothetical protein
LYNGGNIFNDSSVTLLKTSTITKLAEYKSAVMVGVTRAGTGGKDNKNGVCECEARIRAFLRMLRVGEGTGELIVSRDKKTKEIIYIPHDFEKGYTTAFNNNLIADLADHPRIDYGGSSAAGAYQVLTGTWDDTTFSAKRKEYSIDSFSKEDQDKFSVLLMKHHPGCSDLLKILLSGQTENSIRGIASRIWASLPEKGDNSRYEFKGKPQPVTPMKTVLEHYEKFLKDELAGNSPLSLKKGFLKDFDIKCNCKNTDNKNHKEGYDIDKAVNYVIANAASKSLSACALYIRKAINAGGISGSWGDAWEYISALPNIGFTDLGKIDSFEKGDIVVFNKTGGRKYGHISMWTGSQWVSDFKQNSIIVHSDYNGKDYHIFRWQ